MIGPFFLISPLHRFFRHSPCLLPGRLLGVCRMGRALGLLCRTLSLLCRTLSLLSLPLGLSLPLLRCPLCSCGGSCGSSCHSPCRCTTYHLSRIHIGRCAAGTRIKPENHLRVLPQGLQILNHGCCRGIPGREIRAHGMQRNLLKAQRNAGIQLPRRNRRCINMLDGNGNRGFAVIGRLPGKHFVHHNTQRVKIGPCVHLCSLGLLRRDIMYRSQGLSGEGILCGIQPCNAKVGHLHTAILQDHNVVGLDIPVNDSPTVCMLQRLGDLGGKMQRLPPGKCSPLLHILLQGQAIDELHDNIVDIVGVIDIVDRHNVRMGQHGNGLRFRIKSSAEVLIPAQLILEYFYSHISVEPMASGPVDHSHAASSDLL